MEKEGFISPVVTIHYNPPVYVLIAQKKSS